MNPSFQLHWLYSAENNKYSCDDSEEDYWEKLQLEEVLIPFVGTLENIQRKFSPSISIILFAKDLLPLPQGGLIIPPILFLVERNFTKNILTFQDFPTL